MAGFQNVVQGASIYVEGTNYAGVAEEVTLPSITMMENPYRGMGMPSALSRFTGFEELELVAVFNGFINDVFRQVGSPNVREKNYTVRWATESNDGTRKFGMAEAAGRGSVLEHDAFGNGEDPAQMTLTVKCVQYKVEFDGEVLCDIDVENNKFIIGGVDNWEPIASGL